MKRINKLVKYLRMSPTRALAVVGISGAAVALVLKYATDPKTRWALVGCILGIVLLVFVVRALFRWRAEKRARSMYQTLDDEHQRAVAVSPEEKRARVEEMRGRFQQAIEELRRAKKTIYDLPWFLLIGEPQSGKSMTLRGSELNFPVGTERLSGLGGTRNCDWWFANQAVVLDTAGRFTFQEDGAPDRAEWEGFLNLLASKRRRCPINGVIVVVPTDALLNDEPQVRKEKAKNIHAKLGELQRKLGVQFPVFLLITKCDLVVGFSEFFREFGEVQAAQIIGWSNGAPFDQPYDATRLQRDFDEMHTRLCLRRLEVLRQPISFEERGLVYSFPEEFRALAEPLRQYLDIMFAPDIYHDPLFFRGFYFTSGMQEGDPIVKVGREILSGGRPGSTVKEEFDPLGNLFPSRPFFIADVYKAKALRETGMVFRSAADIQRSKKLKRWTYAGGGALGALLGLILLWGGLKVHQLIRVPREDAKDAQKLIVAAEDQPPRGVAEVVDALDGDAKNLAGQRWWFRMTFPFRGAGRPAGHLRRIRDALFVRRELRPAVSRVADTLSDADHWPKEPDTPGESDPKSQERFETMRDGLWEYVGWFAQRGVDGDDPDAATRAFDRLFAPVSAWSEDMGDRDRLRSYFGRLQGDYRTHQRRAIPPQAGEEGGEVQALIEAAKAAYMLKYAGEKSDDLGPWVQLWENCRQIKERLPELYDLSERFGEARTTHQYDRTLADWKRLYSSLEEPPDHRCFQLALTRIGYYLKKLRPLAEETEKEATSLQEVEPEFRKVRTRWTAFFRSDEALQRPASRRPSAGGTPAATNTDLEPSDGNQRDERRRSRLNLLRGQTLFELIEGSDLEPEVARRVQGWIDRALAELDDEAQRVITEQIKNRRRKLDYFFEALDISPQLSLISRKVLSNLDQALPEQRQPMLGRDFDTWHHHLKSKANPAVEAARQPLADGQFNAPDWETHRIAKLVTAVGDAVRRHTWFVELARAQELLADNEIESLRLGYDKGVDELDSGFAGVKRSHLHLFMLEIIKQVEALAKALSTCIDEGACLRKSDSQGARGRADGINPARQVRDLLDAKLTQYARRYFNAWADYYVTQNLTGYDEICRATTWPKCHDLLISPEATLDIYNQARQQLRTFLKSVLEVDEHGTMNEEHRQILRDARRTTKRCGETFRNLKRQLRTWEYAEARRTKEAPRPSAAAEAVADLLAGKVALAYNDFLISVDRIGVLDADSPNSLTGDLQTQSLQDVQKALPAERIIQQLDNIMKWTRYRLNMALDRRLEAALKPFQELYSGALAPFPFRRPEQGPTPKQLSKRDFESFLSEMLQFEQRYSGIGQTAGTQKGWERNNASVGRLEFLDRCKKWRDLLFGGKESAERLGSGQPADVYFGVQYREARTAEYPRVGERDYMKGTLALGNIRGDTGGPMGGRLAQVDFNLTRQISPPKPATRVWRFGNPTDVWFELSEPHQGTPGDDAMTAADSVFHDTPWALPIFIYRYCNSDEYATVQDEQTGEEQAGRVWDVPVKVRIRNNPQSPVIREVYAILQFRVDKCGSSDDCELPPVIGAFHASTLKPTFWNLD